MKILHKIKSIRFVLIFLNISSVLSQDILIKNEETWYYYDQDYLETDWYKDLNLSNWKTGITPIGYGDRKNNTTIHTEKDKNVRKVTKYFAKKIFIKNTHLAYEFKLLRDDGAVVYVNGKELFRDNMPNSTIGAKTVAISTVKDKDEHKYYQHFFDNSIFKEGENTILVSVHQSYITSSDCIFSLELLGHESLEILSFVVENKNKTTSNLENRIELLNLKFENEKTLSKKENLENVKFSLQILVFILSVLLIISIVVIYFTLQNGKKRIAEINQNLIASKSELLEKEKEMVSLSTNLLHHKQYFKEIKADVKGIKTEDKSLIKSINHQIDYVLENDEDWQILKQHFNAVHENFFDKLLAKHPSITETELRHCMFIKLHLQTKEIARILLIDPRSVQTARYRIKKKMDLNEEIDLRDYLLNI
ncbi:hypothetical protein BW723_15185 [Polaribacter reichenbachii]|uniref:HTH luxR-type domain-containing protein n=1 Tax=Polaribacter reichenbachii TaxID=996801 RepID=A0A1B8U5G5_9FLAO|nr:hypothetical protein [Polaribacter reichenbachii]APZ47547.1 hypothetical protein BW723_15185 [Polaribacter reichenbachii]AUC18187.1 hypothetical protein BTO17_05630 [Polaribacter reichenbachii]OBY67100.1 hypothetical protein LPB301_04605 [Polaribacter reichenbachii]